MESFYRLVAKTVVASTTNNFLWFALTFWVYLETGHTTSSRNPSGALLRRLAVFSDGLT